MSANQERGERPLVVGEVTYVLKVTSNAICEMETASGRTFDQIMTRIGRDGSYTDVRWFLWAALRARHPDLTVLAVGDLIDAAGGLGAIKTQLEALLTLNTAEATKAAPTNGNPPEAQPGTGADCMSMPEVLA